MVEVLLILMEGDCEEVVKAFSVGCEESMKEG
jgi:hypothetical protein